MKTRNGFLIIGIGLMTTALFLTGCMDTNLISRVSESLEIQNGTDSTIYVEYGFLDPLNAYYNGGVRDSVPMSLSSRYYFYNMQETDLWMSEKNFNKYVSEIRIYRLVKGDSIFVEPHYYNTKSAWNYKFLDDFNQIQNKLTILPGMFNK